MKILFSLLIILTAFATDCINSSIANFDSSDWSFDPSNIHVGDQIYDTTSIAGFSSFAYRKITLPEDTTGEVTVEIVCLAQPAPVFSLEMSWDSQSRWIRSELANQYVNRSFSTTAGEHILTLNIRSSSYYPNGSITISEITLLSCKKAQDYTDTIWIVLFLLICITFIVVYCFCCGALRDTCPTTHCRKYCTKKEQIPS